MGGGRTSKQQIAFLSFFLFFSFLFSACASALHPTPSIIAKQPDYRRFVVVFRRNALMTDREYPYEKFGVKQWAVDDKQDIVRLISLNR